VAPWQTHRLVGLPSLGSRWSQAAGPACRTPCAPGAGRRRGHSGWRSGL